MRPPIAPLGFSGWKAFHCIVGPCRRVFFLKAFDAVPILPLASQARAIVAVPLPMLASQVRAIVAVPLSLLAPQVRALVAVPLLTARTS